MNGEQLVLFGGRRYPEQPGHQLTDTSLSAAKVVANTAQTLRRAALTSLITDGSATADELAAIVGVSVLAMRPRVTELRKLGAIVDTGERRANESGRLAIVWAWVMNYGAECAEMRS